MNPFATDITSSGTMEVIARVPAVSPGVVNSSPPQAAQSSTNQEHFELIKQVAQALATGDASAARQQLLDGLAKKFGATAAAIGWQRPGQPRWWGAVSGTSKYDRRSESGRMIAAA